ncbi:MAG TPA: PKD domain-containing protein [Telluria sp.]|nr:PKD domain-containing protein [Telluria sp.]
MVDLNTRLHRASKGLVIDAVVALSDSGAVVASANTGLVLLQPVSPFWVGPASAPGVGPLAAAAMVTVGAPLDASVSVASDDPAPGVSWGWGDGSAAEAVTASAGSASGRHVFRAAGIYQVAATVSDRTGKRATSSREVVVYDPAAGVVGGSGWFMSPQGADKQAPVRSEKARFAFAAPANGATGAKGELLFAVGALNLRSTELRLVSLQGSQARFEGRGKVNGAGDYQFTATATTGGRGAGRFAIKLWHADAAGKRTVVDYDNSAQAAGTLADGSIAMR